MDKVEEINGESKREVVRVEVVYVCMGSTASNATSKGILHQLYLRRANARTWVSEVHMYTQFRD